jgi:hypothetical protein
MIFRPAQPQEVAMRAFLIACVVAIIIAAASAILLDVFIQEPSSKSFFTPSVRL